MIIHTNRNGFTLLEILVVISIIGILSAVIYASFGEARMDAKNKAMQTSIKETQLALELYKAENGRYPESCGAGTSGTSDDCPSDYIADSFVPEYIAEIPQASEAANQDCNIRYETDVDGSLYKLTAIRCHAADSADSGVAADTEFARCPSSCNECAGETFNESYRLTPDFYQSYAVYSFGGQCR